MLRTAGADTIPQAGMVVILHRVTPQRQGPIDSVRSGADGGFTFRFRPDSGALYLLSARYGGIEYFSDPLRARPGARDEGVAVLVADTSSTAPVSLAERQVVFPRPTDPQRRAVLEVLGIRNAGSATRIAPDTVRPSWAMRLPAGAADLTLRDGDVPPEAVTLRGDSLLVFAPLMPGVRTLVVEYTVPLGDGTVTIPFDQPVAATRILVEDSSATVAAAGFVPAPPETAEGRVLQAWTAATVGPGEVRVEPRKDAGMGSRALGALVAGLAAVVAAAMWLALRRRPSAVPAPEPPARPAAALVEELARLDATYAGREASTPPAEWEAYLRRRAELKATLEVALAARPTGP